MLLAPTLAGADTLKGDACAGLNTLDNQGDPNNSTCSSASGSALTNIVAFVLNILSAIVGFAAVVMIIVAGLKFITANGDSGSITTARNTILYAVVGLIIVASSQVLVHFVLQRTATAGLCPVAGKTTLQASDANCK